MLMVMTVTGARFVSPRIRLYLGLAITLRSPPIPAVPQDIELLSFRGFMTIAEQIVIGVAMGMVTFMIQTFVLLGQILGMQSSLVLPRWWTNGQNAFAWSAVYVFGDHVFPRY